MKLTFVFHILNNVLVDSFVKCNVFIQPTAETVYFVQSKVIVGAVFKVSGMRNRFTSPQEGIDSMQNVVRCGEMRRKKEEIICWKPKTKKTRFGDRMKTSEGKVFKTETN